MAAINFPESPQDNATFTANGIAYTYNAAKTQWAADNLSIFDSRESPEFTGIPVAPTAAAGTNTTQLATTAFVATAAAAAAGDTLPAQTGNTGKYLTTDGSTTSWAAVSAGAGYEIGDGLELNSVTTIDWSTLPSPLTEINGIASEQYFGGIGLSASDTHIVIGTPGGAGAVTAFDVYSAETGAFLRSIEKIDPAALGDGGFGAFVSISGTKVIMGHPLAASVAGAAYIFEATTGALLHTLSAPTGGAVTTGQAVAISPNYAAVLSLTSAQTSSRIGVYNVSTGALLHTIAQVTNGNGHGSLSITDQYLVAGEPLRDRDGQPTSDNSGAVSVYNTVTGSLLHTIVEPTPSVSGDFGFSVSVHGDYIAIGGAPDTYGAVYVYSASTGSLLHTFQNPLPAETGTTYTYGFGKSVSVYGGYLLVGALDGPRPGTIGDSWGRAYLYDLTNGSLIQTIYGTSNNDNLGDSVAMGPGIIAIGVPQYDSNGLSNNGKAVIYKTEATTNTYLQPDNTIATTSYVDTAVSNLVDSSPAALNTLNELAAALGDDANFSTTVTNTLATKAPLASPTFTGVPVAPTATAGTNTTQLATTAFVTAATANAGGSSDELEFTANGAVTAGKLVVLDAAGTVSQVAASEAGLPQIPYTDLAAGTAGQHVLLWDDYNEELLYIANVANRYNIDITTQSVSKLSQSSWSFNTGSKPQALMIPNTGYFIARGVSPQDMAALILGKNFGGAVSIAASADISSVLQWRYKLSDIHIFPNGEAYLFGSEYISFSEGQPLLSAWKINYDTVANTISLGARQDSTINISAVDNYTFFLNIITDKNNNTFSIYYRGGALYVSPISEAGGAISWGAEKTISVTSSPQYEPWPNRPTSHEKVKYSAHTDRFYLPFKYAATHVGCWVFSLSADGTGILKNTILLSGMPGANEYEAVTIGVSQTTENVGFIINTRTGSPGQNWGNHFGLINADGVYTSSEVYTGTGGNSAGNSYDNPYLSSVDIGGAVVFGMKRFDSITQYSLTLHVARMTTTTNAQNWIGIASDTVSDGSAVNVHLSTGLSNEHTGLSVGSKYYAAADGGLTTTPSLGYGLVGEALSSTTLQIVSESDLSGYATLLNATLVGTPTAPTATAGNASTQIATTAFVADATTSALATKAPLASPTFTGVTTLTATSEVLQPKFSAGFGAVDHDIANGSIFYHDNMMGNFDAAFINVPTTVDLVTSAVLVMADGQVWGPSSYVRVNGTEYVVKWLGGTAPTMSADVVDVVSYSLINRNGTWVVIGSHSAYSAAV